MSTVPIAVGPLFPRPAETVEFGISLVHDGELSFIGRRLDPALSPEGGRRAQALARAMDADPPAVVVASPRKRAVEIAGMIARRHFAVVTIDERLDDVDYGRWSGCSVAEVEARYPGELARYESDPASFCFPGGEALCGAQSRACELVAEIAQLRGLESIAIVTHLAIARLIICSVLGAPLAAVHRMNIRPTTTAALGRRDAMPILGSLAEVSARLAG